MNQRTSLWLMLAVVGACHHAGRGDDDGMSPDAASPGFSGVWSIAGSDGRGAYTGQGELVPDPNGGYRLTRIVEYTTVEVEDGRALWWVWQGSTADGDGTLSVSVALARADFIAQRGVLARSDADKMPAMVTGQLTLGADATLAVHFDGPETPIDETWSGRAPSGTTPIFTLDRQQIAAHDPIPADIKSTLFSAFASFQALPAVIPYVNNPDFQAAQHDIIVDKTDFDFYQAHPDALRVVGKVIDPISLQETLARANAYKWTLAQKAGLFDAEMPASFIEPVSGMMIDSRDGATLTPTGDGALWTATYIASQAYRFQLTGDAAALDNIVKSIGGILTLTEITGNPRTFARTLRAASGNASGVWHAGTGAFATLDWMEGGNNDMFKGLAYGTLTAYMALCDPVQAGQEALCNHIQTAVKHIADDLDITQNHDTNRLIAQWVAAYVTGEPTYLSTATAEWALQSVGIEQANFQMSSYATADWSGTHLTFVEFIVFYLLDGKKPLSAVDTSGPIAAGVDKMKVDFARFRMGLWSLLFATVATTPDPTAADVARWRLREMSAPKIRAVIDHRVSDAYVMSPFPALPWKADWTVNDRTASLRGYPMFEISYNVYAWKSSPFDYHVDTSSTDLPAADYLHAYWLARRLNVLTAAE